MNLPTMLTPVLILILLVVLVATDEVGAGENK
ncbi:MAG: hypothetical protein JWM32_881 [Verrucomicrobia bacterium]|nr:hypothetical protein [Verrucomicrobiota bacterium]